MAASRTTKRRAADFTSTTEQSSSPAGPTNHRPGSIAKRRSNPSEGQSDRVRQRRGGGHGFVAVGDTEAAAAIHRLHGMPGVPQGPNQRRHPGEGRVERSHRQDLAADMHAEAHGPDTRQPGRVGIERCRPVERDPELVVRPARGDLRVRAGIHVGVDTQRHLRNPAHPARDAGQQGQLLRAFDVDLTDTPFERQLHLPSRLADACEHDVRRVDTGLDCRDGVRHRSRRRPLHPPAVSAAAAPGGQWPSPRSGSRPAPPRRGKRPAMREGGRACSRRRPPRWGCRRRRRWHGGARPPPAGRPWRASTDGAGRRSARPAVGSGSMGRRAGCIPRY